MLSKKIENAINKQINAELWSAYLYLSMSSYFESINLGGFANWMRVQAHEELGHAMKFYTHVVERRGRVIVTAIAAPTVNWKSPLNAFEDAFKHEQKVTGLINDIANMAATEKDHATANMLQWFIDEQVEEELSTDAIVQKLKMIGTNTGGLYMLDRELAQRKVK
ncbi:MAG: ferritin [Thermoplasmatota archaeon]